LGYVAFLGPFYLFLYLWDSRRFYPAAKYWSWLPLALLFMCAYFSFTLSYSPYWIGVFYVAVLLVIFGASFIYIWVIDSKIKERVPRSRTRINFSRGIAWMLFVGILFWGLSNVVQGITYWLMGEYIAVYFSSAASIFNIWLFIGLVFGFVYGVLERNRYMDMDIPSLLKSSLLIFVFITMQSVLILFLVIYPLQRLTPISYTPQMSDLFCYVLILLTVPLSIICFMPRVSSHGLKKSLVTIILAMPLSMLHSVVLSGYTITLDLTIASILEDNRKLSSAKTVYAKTVPYIRHDHLLASLHHRQGVLNVLNQDYETALTFFKKIMADYCENYGVYRKASRYVESYEKNKPADGKKRKILSVRHKTFEQAASCFPNSLSVILSFYEKEPISTRKLSYSIKESFDEGTFIWKAESFLAQNDYRLITTFWQNKKTLISLLDADYPVLIYIPGHVYTLYGYDSRMEMFLTYDTAKLNRWDDNPFREFQKTWMNGSFLMSVVVKKGDEERLKSIAPRLFQYSDIHQLWQKAQISEYYEYKNNYWKDYDTHKLSESIGLDGLKINDPDLHRNALQLFPWDAEKWQEEIVPVLNNPWATDWDMFERFILYLLHHGETQKAQHLLDLYQNHLVDEFDPGYSRFLELKLAAEIAADNEEEILSVADKLMGITDENDGGSYWGYYFKGKSLMKRGDLKGAVQLLLPVLNKLELNYYSSSKAFRSILEILDEINRQDPSLIAQEKKPLLQVGRIHFAMNQ